MFFNSNKNQIYFFIFFIILFTILAYISYQNFCLLNQIDDLKEAIEILSQKIVTLVEKDISLNSSNKPSSYICPALDDTKYFGSNFKSSGDYMLQAEMASYRDQD
jgi:hypothetical protein